MNYWLLKSDAEAYSIDDLKNAREGGAHEKQGRQTSTTAWTGVRNYQARNFMRDTALGDMCLFYHSGMGMQKKSATKPQKTAGKNAKPTGIYGLVKVVAKAHPDETQFDPQDRHFEPRSLIKDPKTGKTERKTVWECVDIKFVEKFKEPIPLTHIKRDPALEGMAVRQAGSRLSVQPVSAKHFEHIVKLAGSR